MGVLVSRFKHAHMKLFSFLASVALVRSGLVQDDGTVRDSDGTLCASNERNQLRVKPCDASDARQVFDKAHWESTGQIKNAYTDSVVSDHCVAFRNNGYPLKMKPCSHR